MSHYCQQDFLTLARAALPDELWAYLIGGSESETALRRNQNALQSFALVPRVLVDVQNIDHSLTFLGCTLTLPILLAPIGSVHLLREEGVAGVAAAAENAGVAYCVGGVVPGAEKVMASEHTPAFYQIYINDDQDWVDQQCQQALHRGFAAIIITLDAPVFPIRRRDVQVVNHASNRQRDGTPLFRKTFSWQLLQGLIRRNPDIPIILKGIQDKRDAQRALDLGVAAVYLSNHGGRQYDQGPGTAHLIEGVARTLNGQTTLIVDGGVATGNDVLKALALGADVVGIGRSYLFPYVSQGVDGLTNYLDGLARDLYTNMSLLGVPGLKDIRDIEIVNLGHPGSQWGR